MLIKKIANVGAVVAKVIDNLISTSATDALSAKQGKNIKDNLTQQDMITGSSVKCGYKVDNKDLYVKRIDCGAMPNATSKFVATGLTPANITVISFEGSARRSSDGVCIPLPWFLNTAASGIQMAFEADGTLSFVTTVDRSAFLGKVNIYYTIN